MELSKEEKERKIERLTNFLNIYTDSREMKRALAVKLALQGSVYRAIRNILNISEGFVSTALCVTKRYSNSSEQNNFRFA